MGLYKHPEIIEKSTTIRPSESIRYLNAYIKSDYILDEVE